MSASRVLSSFRSFVQSPRTRFRSASLMLLFCVSACGPKADSVDPGAAATSESSEAGKAYPEPPAAGEARDINFPAVQSFVVEKNGLRVYVIENHEVPLVNIDLQFKVGDIDDPVLGGLTAQMLREGTRRRPKATLDAQIAQLGADLRVHSGMHSTTISTQVLSKDFNTALALMEDVAHNPRFDAKSLEKVKSQSIVGIAQAKAQPSVLASALFLKLVYPDGHPYGATFPSNEQVQAVSIAALKKFHSTYYKANNATLILAGDVTVASVKGLVSKIMHGFPYAKPDALPPSPLKAIAAETYEAALPEDVAVHIIDLPIASTEIRVGNLSMARLDPNWNALQVVNRVLGATPSSRLFQDMREKRKLTYGIYSEVSTAQAPGTFVISTQTTQIDEMMRGIFEHIASIRNQDPTPAEYESAVRGIVQAFPLQIETAEQVADLVENIVVFSLPEDYYQSYRKNVMSVKREDLRKIAEQYIHSNPVVVFVGPKAQILQQLEYVPRLSQAPVHVYDVHLNKVSGP